MNKKGFFEEVVNLFRLLFMVVVFLSFILLARAFIIQKVDTFDVESKLLANRLAFSNGINHVDKDINRLYIGTIDLQKFTSNEIQRNLLNSIYHGKLNSEASAKLTLKNLDENKEYITYYNKELYDEKKVLLEAKLIGKGAAKNIETTYYAVIKDGDKFKKGVLKIEAILPNS